MQAYQEIWEQEKRWKALKDKVLNGLLLLLLNRYFIVLYAYSVRNRDTTTQHMSQLYV